MTESYIEFKQLENKIWTSGRFISAAQSMPNWYHLYHNYSHTLANMELIASEALILMDQTLKETI